MKQKFKALGLCFVAVFAFSAVAASAAQAAEYHAEKGPVYYTGTSSDNVFTITHSPTNVAVKCSVTKVKGENASANATTVTVHPEYETCTLNGVKATIATNACNYQFNQPNASNVATVNIVGCVAGAPITVTSTGCTLKVTNQGPLSSVTFDNEGTGTTRDIKATVSITGITAEQSSGCPGGAGTFATSDYTGSVTVLGYSNSTHTTRQGIFVS